MFKRISYAFGLIFFIIFAFLILKNANLNNFIDTIENRTFDLRQSILINEGTKKANQDIVIVAIDDATYEYILDNYGEWPLPRDTYAKIVNYLEKQNPRIIAFDLMFVKSLKSKNQADKELTEIFKKYNNVFTSMNFDNQSEDLRIPPNLPQKLTIDIKNNSKIDFSQLTYKNCRTIIDEIINATSNIGIINVSRSDDGILRKMPLVVKYKNDYYPQLALKVGLNYLGENQTSFEIDKHSEFKLGDRKIYLDNDGSAILNWYGPAGTYTYIPMYQLIKAVNGEKTELDYNFSNKIIYFGTTAASLFDIKTVPTGKIYPGVEIQATYVNNIIDNNFIKKVNRGYTIALSILLALFIASVVTRVSSAFTASMMSLSAYFIYILIAYYSMKYENLWLEVVYPLIFSIAAFTFAYVVKYLIKSRDFEQQYKLATTDGLTELYNHRYFQEQIRMQIEQSKRYNHNFSLIIIDIDFFKKFNDTFGHQSGDAVLRQVAQTLKKNVRATDIVCRYGGEEMSIILPNTGKDEAFSTAQKICERVASKKFKLAGDKETNVTISLGVSTFPYDGDSASSIIEAADKRLYNAKNNGRNQVG
ncbi:diguanylate cyclase with Chase2 sensor [Clostridium sp. CAG:768]|nr:diguanylate cyclase with Chase2 sensor [Clostridium sp. CAG:768]